MTKSCCSGETHSASDAPHLRRAAGVPLASETVRARLRDRLVPIKGGFFDMGARKSTYPADFDAPRRRVKLSGFAISPTAISNADFALFVDQTGYRTVAEVEGWSYVFHLLLADPERWPQRPRNVPWWHRVNGAYWAAPEGPGTDVAAREDHPAVHISWFDAVAYCTWSGLSLPTEAQWEFAARGGLARRKFPWGDALLPGGKPAMNTWQGRFPHENTAEDGYIGTAPVTAFRPNGFGLYNMCGNVWEWVQDRFLPRAPTGTGPFVDPTGPSEGGQRVQRGGSYLCHDSYCDRYHVHSRSPNDPSSSTGNLGFRVGLSDVSLT